MGVLTNNKKIKAYKDRKNKIIKRSMYYFDFDNSRCISFEDQYDISANPSNIILRHVTQKI